MQVHQSKRLLFYLTDRSLSLFSNRPPTIISELYLLQLVQTKHFLFNRQTTFIVRQREEMKGKENNGTRRNGHVFSVMEAWLPFIFICTSVCTFMSLIWRYSSMMAVDFLFSSSSVKAGLLEVWAGGGVAAVSRFAVHIQIRN